MKSAPLNHSIRLLFCILGLCAGTFANGATSTVIQNFESTLSGWSTEPRSVVSTTSAPNNVFSGNGALQWVYTKATSDWDNKITYTFSSAQNWSGLETLSFYIKSDFLAAGEQKVRLNLTSNGVETTHLYNILTTGSFQQVSLSLLALSADKINNVTKISFWVNGSNFTNSTAYTFYIDDITVSGAMIPEPSTAAIIASLICVTAVSFRRVRAKS